MLFEFNNLNDNNDIDLTYLNIPLNNSMDNTTSNNKLYSTKEGFLKGNMFKDEYDPYKNYAIATINPSNSKEELALKIYELDFALNDLNLYLDLHPEDTTMFDTFKKNIKELNRLKEQYIDAYGPLCLTDVTGSNYSWLNKFPWEKGGSI